MLLACAILICVAVCPAPSLGLDASTTTANQQQATAAIPNNNGQQQQTTRMPLKTATVTARGGNFVGVLKADTSAFFATKRTSTTQAPPDYLPTNHAGIITKNVRVVNNNNAATKVQEKFDAPPPPPHDKNITCQYTGPTTVECNGSEYKTEDQVHPGSPTFWIYLGVCVALICMAAIAAGLTMGLMSMDVMNLEILQRSGTPQQQRHAARILPLVQQHHLLLVTLLLMNSAANEALPIFLDRILSPIGAIVLSVSAVLIFGEIVPQALCTRFGLQIGSFCSPLVWVLLIITWPISWPIAKLLDVILGKETGTFYRRAQLKELVNIHTHLEGDYCITADESSIIRGALDLSQKTVGKSMTPVEEVFMLPLDGRLDHATLRLLRDKGHSRVPIYFGNRGRVVGMLLVKSCLLVDPNEEKPIRNVNIRNMPIVPMDKGLYDMLKLFQTGRSHIALVVDSMDHMTVKGIVTLEDLMEELIGEEIYDETDFAPGQQMPPNTPATRGFTGFLTRNLSSSSLPFAGGGGHEPRHSLDRHHDRHHDRFDRPTRAISCRTVGSSTLRSQVQSQSAATKENESTPLLSAREGSPSEGDK